jgi:hypothetical protein
MLGLCALSDSEGDLARTGDHWDGERYVDSSGRSAPRPVAHAAIIDAAEANAAFISERRRAWSAELERRASARPRATRPFRPRSLRRVSA